MTIRWGIIGPGAIAHNYADGLAQSTSGKLVAIAGRDAARRAAFGDAYAIPAAKRFATYAAIMADPEVDAIYISTPHPWHAELSIAALRAGKHVLCEKPAGMNSAEVIAVTEVATQEGRFFMEAFMYRCHPQIARALEIITSGEIGTPQHIRTQFGFNAPYRDGSRLYEMALGGGGTLDVPIAEAEFADRPKVMAACPKFAAKQSADQPTRAFESRSDCRTELGRNQPAGNIDRQHFFQDLALTTHNVKRKADEDQKERQFEDKVTDREAFETTDERHSVPDCVQSYRTDISHDRH